MNLKRTVECFRFALGCVVFIPLALALGIRILHKPSEKWSELASEKLYVSNALKVAELDPVYRLKLGPFENVDDGFYYLEDGEEMAKDNRQTVRKTGNGKTASFAGGEKTNAKHALSQAQERNIFSLPRENVRDEIDEMKAEIRKLKKLSRLSSKLYESENSSLDHLEKLLEVVGSREGLYVNNRFEIDSVFVVNELSVDGGKGADARLMMPLPTNGILNNLKEGKTNPCSEVEPNKSDLKRLEVFSKMFQNGAVTVEQIDKMSRIVDFVERYHGVVANLKTLDLSWEEILKGMKEKVTRTGVGGGGVNGRPEEKFKK